MFKFILFLFKFFFSIFNKNIYEIIKQYAIVKKENEILKRQVTHIKFNPSDRIFFVLCLKLFKHCKDYITLVRPETIFKWYRNLIKRFWTFPNESSKAGRPGTPKYIRYLILEMKNNNFIWGNKKIQGELKKLGIELDKKTIAKIVQNFRNDGKIKTDLSWSKFIKSHFKSLFGTDLFVVDTLFNIRLYVFFIIHYKTREIIQFAITTNPKREFIRQQIIEFLNNVVENMKDKVYLIHDRSGEFLLNFIDYGIHSIKTSVKAPNMNTIAERFIGSIRREC